MSVDDFYFCCNKEISEYLITFSVVEEQKIYRVCMKCSKLDCFKQFVISKIPFDIEEIS